MKLLVVGSGGREHALIWKLAQSPEVEKLYCAPGNGGTRAVAENVPIAANDITRLCEFAESEQIDLTVVGPELPLSLGIVDEFEKRGLHIFGPTKAAAQLETSKAFAKEFMWAHGIPTACGTVASDPDLARDYVRDLFENGALMIYVKASGLASGKGAICCQTQTEGLDAVHLLMEEEALAEAGRTVVVERALFGEEASFHIFTDGVKWWELQPSQDHKHLTSHPRSPMTGGMGAIAPVPLNAILRRRIAEDIIQPTLTGMRQKGMPYRGVLYIQLMIVDTVRPFVIEYNARFGDPEAQAILMLVKDDLVPVMRHIAGDERVIQERQVLFTEDYATPAAACIVLASEGYPLAKEYARYQTQGLADAESMEGVRIFHAGTAFDEALGRVVTSGGRVVGVTAVDESIDEACKRAYAAIEKINFPGMKYRRDIKG